MAGDTGTRTVGAAWGGIVLSIIGIHWHDILQTAVLAALGTTVSFCASHVLKKLYKRFKRS